MSGHLILAFNLCAAALVVGLLGLSCRAKSRRPATLIVSFGALLLGGVVGAFAWPIEGFGKLQLLTWALFAHYPLFLLGAAGLLYKQKRPLALVCVLASLTLLSVAADAFLLEPHWLEVTRLTITSDKLERPLRIAVIADLQTDAPGDYEARALRLAAAEQPDLILLAGDYVQQENHQRYAAASQSLNQVLRRANLDAALGVHAVRGNVDWATDWTQVFAGLPITLFEATETLDLGPLVLTGLTMEDSVNPALAIGAQDKFHIVLGHNPNFSLGAVEADLLVAGHTHGGQVQLPWIGPLLTLSQVPRSWASGLTMIAPGKYLLVSRGVGLERGLAPRLRFLCRPQIVIIDLLPE